MNEKAIRLNEAYRHVFAFYGIDSKNKFAEAVKVQRTAMSAAMNGNIKYLTKNLFIKVCAAFPDVFNLEYLINGTGTLLTIEEETTTDEVVKHSKSENETNIIDTLGGVVKDVERELADIRLLRVELQQARDDFRTETVRLSNLIRQLSNSFRMDVATDENPRPK